MTMKRILAVEDEAVTVMALEETLERLGYHVVGTVDTGKDAIDETGTLKPDLVLMDIHLHGEMDGVQAAVDIRNKFRIPVVFLTAHADQETLDRAKISEPYGYIIKPFQERELKSNIEIALYKHGTERALAASREREQYNAFQAGVAEMSTSILHNIGNAIMSIAHRAQQMEDAGASLKKMAGLFAKMKELVRKKQERGKTPEELLGELLEILEEVGRDLHAMADDRFIPHSRQIGTAVNHISEIIKIHQDSAHPQMLTTRFDLRKLLEDAIAIQQDTLKKYGVEARIEMLDDFSDVDLPRSQLLQLCINLIKNGKEAIEARKKRESVEGKVTVSAKKTDAGEIEMRVADNGCGIPSDKLQDIFGYGFSTKKRGTGFGLHSAALFTQSVGGAIEARSDGLNKGAELVVRLPLKMNGSKS